MIPSLLQQVATIGAYVPMTAKPTVRQERMENILMLMMGRNVYAVELSQRFGKSCTAINKDLKELADEGYTFSWRQSDGKTTRRMWSLTESGVLRARKLKEMSDGQDVEAQH